MHTIIVTILLGLLSQSVSAETLFVRPGSGHGTGSGTSYANAFSDFEGIVWGAGVGELGAGDTLIVCGSFTSYGLQTKRSGVPGQPITIDGNCSAHGGPSRAVLNPSGSALAYPALSTVWSVGPGATFIAYPYVNYKNMELAGRAASAGRVFNITASTRTTPLHSVITNLIVRDSQAGGSNPQPCIRLTASNVVLKYSTIRNCSADGIYAEGNDNEIAYNTIYDVDLRTDVPDGDCIQFGSSPGVANTGNWIHHNTLDCRGHNAKHALMMSSDSDLSIYNRIEHNTMYGGATVLNLNPFGGVVRFNRLYTTPGGQGTPRGVVNIECQIGDNLGKNTIHLYSNLVVGEDDVYPYGIYADPSGVTHPYHLVFANNTIVGFSTTGIRAAANTLIATAINNIVMSFSATQAFSFGSATVTTRKHNIWFGVAQKNQAGGAPDNSMGDLNIDPLLVHNVTGTSTPTQPPGAPGIKAGNGWRGDYRPTSSSPANGSGDRGMLCHEIGGKPCKHPQQIGAYQGS